jgi:hypothetical protein
MMLVWGGASEAKADVTYTKVSEVNFNNESAGYIPTGWTVVHNGVTRESGTDCNSIRGSRIFEFSNSVQSFNKALYIGVSWDSIDSNIKASYATYGDLDGHALTLPSGNVELRVPAFLWKSGGSTNLVVKLAKKSDTSFSNPILDEKEGLTYNVNGNQSNDLSGIQTLKFQLSISEEDAGDYYLMLGAERVGNSELMLGGFSVYTYEGTPSKYDDATMVFEEKFASTNDNCAPIEGTGWVLRDQDKNNVEREKTPGTGYSGDGIRIFKLSCSEQLSSAFYCNGSTSTATYGEGINGEDEKLYLEAGEYFVSYYAAAWKKNWNNVLPTETFKILDADGNAVVSHERQTTVNCNSSRTDAITADHVQFTATVTTDGYYTLQLSSNGETFVGSISIRKNTKLSTISGTFTGLNDASPAVGSGWTIYQDSEQKYAAHENGKTGLSNARLKSISNGGVVTNVAYLRFNGALTYGEDENLPLTLVGGKEYRISYYAASQDATPRTVICSISTTASDGEVTTALSRSDVMAGYISSWSVVRPMDYIETTFIPAKSGNYILKLTGYQVHVANITLAENFENPIAYQATLDAAFGYSTLYVDRAVAVPSDVEVYSAALNADGDKVVLTQITDNVPAGTAVIVKGTPGATVTFEPATAPAEAVEDNILAGKLVGTALPTDANYYTLAYTDAEDESTLGFYKSSANALRANKAYITLPAASSIASLRFDFDTDEPGNVTAIEQVKSEAAAGAIFDLNGRRVATMSKPGLYIVGGRKVMVK